METGGEIVFSVDDFHLPYVRPEIVAQAANFIVKRKGHVEIRTVLWQRNVAIDRFLKSLLADKSNVHSRRIRKKWGEGTRVITMYYFDGGKVGIHSDDLTPSGRAEWFTGPYSHLVSINDIDASECSTVLTLLPNGDVRFCCEGAGPEFGFLTQGNMRDTDLGGLLSRSLVFRSNERPILRSMRLWRQLYPDQRTRFPDAHGVCYALGCRLTPRDKLIELRKS
jgi:hypothetical protein